MLNKISVFSVLRKFIGRIHGATIGHGQGRGKALMMSSPHGRYMIVILSLMMRRWDPLLNFVPLPKSFS